MEVEFIFFVKPLNKNKFINKYGMPIPKNSLKVLLKDFLSIPMTLNLLH